MAETYLKTLLTEKLGEENAERICESSLKDFLQDILTPPAINQNKAAFNARSAIIAALRYLNTTATGDASKFHGYTFDQFFHSKEYLTKNNLEEELPRTSEILENDQSMMLSKGVYKCSGGLEALKTAYDAIVIDKSDKPVYPD